MLFVFLKALAIGFSIAMPVGPIGMLCIKNTLSHGFKIGVATGLGAAFADSFYGFLGGGGLAILSQFLLNYTNPIKISGGLALLLLGLNEIRTANNLSKHAAKINAKGFSKTTIASFFLTLSSPATIIAYVAVFAALGGSVSQSGEILVMIFGVFCGSLFWWLILAGIVAKIKHKIPEKMMIKIKILSGLILSGFGAYAVSSALT